LTRENSCREQSPIAFFGAGTDLKTFVGGLCLGIETLARKAGGEVLGHVAR